MKRKSLKRIGAAIMSLMLMAQGVGTMSPVFAAEQKVRSDSQTQMSSEPEVVYVNNYNDASVRTQNFNSNWKFYLGDAGEAQTSDFDDSKWRQISLPHDYSIEQNYSSALDAESGYLPGGTGWYRKSFVVGKELEGKRIRLDFDGVYMNSTVWVNGQKMGTHPFGYTPFSYDITDYLNFGGDNTIAVKVDHKTPSSRWYSGSGIYRDVNLTVMDAVHVDLYGTKIETPNLEAEQGGTVNMDVKTTVANESEEAQTVVLTHTIYEDGTENAIGTVTTEGQEVAAGETAEIAAVLPAANPELWGTENPALYTVVTEVKVGDAVVDTYESEYGFRYFAFDTETGFSLNGENMKLKGVCMHHDQGALGSVANARAIERQVEILKEMGCNSIRVTHNPAAKALLDACNRHGMLVIDEFFDGWMYAKNGNTNDYSVWFNKNIEEGNMILGGNTDMTWAEFDLKATVKRGQNDPSIIMWSLGNEIQEGTYSYNGYQAKSLELIKWTQELDTTRKVTIGSNAVKNEGANGEHTQIGNNVTAAGGVSGTNYSRGASYDSLHSMHPDWYLLGSETASTSNSRGIYFHKGTGGRHESKQLTSYDKSSVSWGAVASSAWYDTITRDFLAGEYVWTGFDYIGEPTPWNGTNGGAQGPWPSPKNSYFGIIDTAGFPKDSYYLYQSQWNDDVNTLHILPTWNEDGIVKDASGNVEVVVYSDAAKVELYLNDELVGTQEYETITTPAGYTYQKVKGAPNTHTSLYMTFWVPYEEGTLRAVAYDAAGNVIEDTEGRSYVTTTGEEAKLAASADRTEIKADGSDLTYITVDVTDADGNIVPDAANRVTFDVEGDGVLVGVDNGSSPDHDSYKADNRCAFSGKVLAIVQSTKKAGNIKVTATAEGLKPAVVNVKTTAVDDGEVKKEVSNFLMSKIYYVKKNNMPQLPTEIETRYTDGTVENRTVTWDAISEDQIQGTGSFRVSGLTEDGYVVSVIINMIDEVAGVLNYSTTVAIGTEPILPPARAAVMEDGSVLSALFPVDWVIPEDADFGKEGIVVIPGTANVLGTEINVTASVRVQKEGVTIGDSVSGAAYLTQNIPAASQSDTLDAIKDGRTTIDPNSSGGPNPSAWSNWKYSKEGNNKAEITFRYDTEQLLGQIVIHFAKDGGSMRYPDAGTTEIFVSPDGDNWTKLDTRETIAAADTSTNVRPYTYDFVPTGATFVKLCLTNADVTTPSGVTCTAITEAELKKATGNGIMANKTAKLDTLTVNGVEVADAIIATGSYSTRALFADVEAATADNASLTVLPAYENVIRMIIESEDHKTRNVFEVKLAQDSESEVIGDDSRDYPVEKCTPSAGSAHKAGEGAVEGPVELALDGKAGTWWHTEWGANAGKYEDLWYMLELEEVTLVDGLRYLPRQSAMNGRVKDYKVECSLDGETWTTVGEGTWNTNDLSWKTVEFAQPVEAKFVRLTGVSTVADSGANKFMSASEIRVRMADTTKPSLEDLDVEVPASVRKAGVSEENPATVDVVVKDGETTLRYGYDYLVTYENNTTYGTAKVIVEGIVGYRGTVEKEFVIESIDKEDLTFAIDYAKSQQADENYAYVVPAVKKAFEAALANAEAVMADDAADQLTVDAAYDKLLEMCSYLLFTGNSESLKVLVDEVKAMNLDIYTEETRAAIEEALANAEAVLANENALQDEIDAARDALQAAMDNLVLNPVDKSKLEKLVKKADKYLANIDEYTDVTKGIFVEALDKAKAVLANDKATQEDVDLAYANLQNAIFGLRFIPNKDKLEELINKAEALDLSKYTAETAAAVNSALARAYVVFEDENATEEEVKKAEKDLQKAMSGLKLAGDTTNKDNNKTDKKDTTKPAKTGDSAMPMVFMLLAAVSVVVVFKKKRA